MKYEVDVCILDGSNEKYKGLFIAKKEGRWKVHTNLGQRP